MTYTTRGGDVVEVMELRRTGKTKTMQERYGTIDGKQCRTCTHCKCHGSFYKCELWLKVFPTGHSEASDIRLKWTACKKYEEVEE